MTSDALFTEASAPNRDKTGLLFDVHDHGKKYVLSFLRNDFCKYFPILQYFLTTDLKCDARRFVSSFTLLTVALKTHLLTHTHTHETDSMLYCTFPIHILSILFGQIVIAKMEMYCI